MEDNVSNPLSNPQILKEICDVVHRLEQDSAGAKTFVDLTQLSERVAKHGIDNSVKETVIALNRSVKRTRAAYTTYLSSCQHWKNVQGRRCCCRICGALSLYIDTVHNHLFTLISQRQLVENALARYIQGKEQILLVDHQLGLYDPVSFTDGYATENYTCNRTDVSSEPINLTDHEQDVYDPGYLRYAREPIDVGSEEVEVSFETSPKV